MVEGSLARGSSSGEKYARLAPPGHTLQKPSVNTSAETDRCFVGVFHTLNQRRAQLYH